MNSHVSIIGLGVNDLKLPTLFYSTVCGWKPTEASNENITFFQLNGILLSLYPKDKLAEDAGVSSKGNGFNAFSLAHLLSSDKEVDQLFMELKKRGVDIVKNPEKAFWGGYSGYVADPDGSLWEIAFNPFVKMDSDGNLLG